MKSNVGESKTIKGVKKVKNKQKHYLEGKKMEVSWRESIFMSVDKPEIVFKANYYEAGLWLDVFEQAGLLDKFWAAVLRCPYDCDGECAKHGCLGSYMLGYIFDVDRLIVVNQKAREWLDRNPYYENNMEKGEAKRRKDMTIEPCDASDHCQTVKIMAAVVSILRKLAAKGTKEIRYENLGFTLECPPQCPRIMYLSTSDSDGTIGTHLVDYKCAKRLGYEELTRLMRLSLTAEEVKSTGVVLMGRPDGRLVRGRMFSVSKQGQTIVTQEVHEVGEKNLME